ncbi:MAG: HDOD domain-containing protein [bacterium]|nr:HDOD domain-containing protein [bacterium]
MSLKEDLAFIQNIEEFPSMPSVVLNLMAKMNDPEITVGEIEKYIDMDPALVSYILRITNSLIFGLREEVYSVRRAVTLIGMSNLKSLLTSYSIRLLCKTITHVDAQQYIWNHSLAVGVLARVIALKVYKKEQPEIYVLGLLHDIGKIVLYMHNGQGFLKSLEMGIAKNMDFVTAEKELFGYSHIEVGYFMMGKLEFSKSMKEIVLFHHDPEFCPPDDKFTWIVSLSNELAHHLYDNKNIDIRRYLEMIELSQEEFKEVVKVAQQQVQQYQAIL